MTAYRNAPDEADRALAQSIADGLAPDGFKAKDIGAAVGPVKIIGAWVRKTWNTNRAVAHLRAPAGDGDLGELAQSLKMQLGQSLGYFPFFYGLGLQVVWSGEGILGRAQRLESSVDSVDNQRCIIQSIFVVDFAESRFVQARTWGQVITGKFQDRIAEHIQIALMPSR